MKVALLDLGKVHAEPKKELDATYAPVPEGEIYLHAGLDGARDISVPIVPSWADRFWQLFGTPFSPRSFAWAEKLANSALSFPMGPYLTALQLSHTIARVREFV